MKVNFVALSFVLSSFFLFLPLFAQTSNHNDYLTWSVKQSEDIGKSMRINGKVGSAFDFRVINTNHAINYKLRATLLTPEVIRAAARLEQIRNRLTIDQTQDLVDEAEFPNEIIIMVELDPREGSGVIPLDWRVFLQSKNYKEGMGGWAISGTKRPELKKYKALSGVFKRDYNYDVFWVSFPLTDDNKSRLIPKNTSEFELFVGIYSKEGR